MVLIQVLAAILSTGALAPQCPKENQDVTAFLPNLQNCSKYYMCSHGSPIEMDCPAGLFWNHDELACDFKCRNIVKKLANLLEPTTPVAEGPEVKAIDCNPPTNELGFPIFHSHESDCTKYYVCAPGGPVLMGCPRGLFWNAELDTCDRRCVPKE